MGGYIDHKLFHDGGDKQIEVHFKGLRNIVKHLSRKNLIRFVQIGSSDEYGNLPSPQRENFREKPISPYSLAKLSCTNFLHMLNVTENFPSTILRLFLTYGPGQDLNRFLPHIINSCLNNKEFNTTKGNQLRDFCYVDDVINAIFLALKSGKANGQIFNVGSGKPISIKKITNTIHKIIKKGKPQFGKIPYRKGENMKLYANINKIKKILKWYPKINLQEGIRRTIESYR